MDTGIEGFWNDMNEPALFYSTDSLENAFETADKMRHENLGIDGAFKLKDAFVNIANSDEDYHKSYHTVDGQPVRHDKVHNLRRDDDKIRRRFAATIPTGAICCSAAPPSSVRTATAACGRVITAAGGRICC